MKRKILNYLLFVIFILCSMSKVYAFESKITPSKCTSYTESECSTRTDCTWISELNCGIRDINNISYTCYYLDENIPNDYKLITAYFNEKGLSSAEIDSENTNLGSIQYKAAVDNSSINTTANKNGVTYYTCPAKIYVKNIIQENSKKHKWTFTTKENEKFSEEHSFKLSKNGNDTLIMGIKELPSGKIEIEQSKEPKQCLYILNKDMTDEYKITVTYHNDNKIGVVMDTYPYNFEYNESNSNFDGILESDEFKNWECAEQGELYLKHNTNDNKMHFMYKSYADKMAIDLNGYNKFESLLPNSPNDGDNDIDNCELIPGSIMEYIRQALRLIRWIGLVLMIILGVLDFAKAVSSDDQEAVKKAWQKVVKRLIAVIILFLLPLLVYLILDLVNLNNGCKIQQ